jgi:Zn-dependent peptidase ImmA (M78 family)
MGNKDGKTEFTRDTVIVSVKKSVHEKATFGDGRARMTLAHELAHGVMHHGLVSYRSSGATGSTDLSKINASESAEHQAKVFASAFLIDDKIAAALHNPKEIATEFLVSLEAAEICFDRLFAESERAESAKRVQKMNEEFKAAVRSPKTQPTIARPCYLNENCTNCSQQKLIPIGSKYLCDNCGWVSDQFQDGDRSGGS